MARKRADIDVVYPGEGLFEVDGYRVGDTIAATRTLNDDYKTYAREWSVTHVPTGLAFLAGVPKGVAVAYADRLVELGYDHVHETDPDKVPDELGPGLGAMATAIGARGHLKVKDLVAYVQKLTPAKAGGRAPPPEKKPRVKSAANRAKDEREAKERRPYYKRDLAVYRKLKPGDVVRVHIISTSWHLYDGKPGRKPKRSVDYVVVSKSQRPGECLAELRPAPDSKGAAAKRWGTLVLRGAKGNGSPNAVVLQHRPEGEGSAHTTGAWVHLEKPRQPRRPQSRRKPRAAPAPEPVEIDFLAMVRAAED